MDCRITSTKGARSRGGFTLVEFLVAMAISSLVLAAIAVLTFYSGRSFAALANYVDLEHQSRKALDMMSKEIRQTEQLTEFTSNRLTFEDHDGNSLTYEYDPDTQRLLRIKDGQTQVLLDECDYLNFGIYQRNPVGGTYNQYPTATPETCKLVQLTWICSREIFGQKVNTESVQSAKVVIRKQ